MLKQVCDVLAVDGLAVESAATSVICSAEIISAVRAHAIIHLPKIVPVILNYLKSTSDQE